MMNNSDKKLTASEKSAQRLAALNQRTADRNAALNARTKANNDQRQAKINSNYAAQQQALNERIATNEAVREVKINTAVQAAQQEVLSTIFGQAVTPTESAAVFAHIEGAGNRFMQGGLQAALQAENVPFATEVTGVQDAVVVENAVEDNTNSMIRGLNLLGTAAGAFLGWMTQPSAPAQPAPASGEDDIYAGNGVVPDTTRPNPWG